MGSLSDFLSSIDQSTVILFVIFIVAFAVLFFAFLKFFKKNQAIAGTVAVALAFLITYGMSKMDLDLENIFFEIGLSEELLSVILPIIGILVGIFVIIKLKKKSLFVFGGLLVLAAFFTYEKIVPIVIGCILIFIGIVISRKKDSGRGSGKIWGGDRE